MMQNDQSIKHQAASIDTVLEGQAHTDQLGLERLVFFSDGVFAIASTLLALEIRLPETGQIWNNTQLFQHLLGMAHAYLAYLISFLVVGTFWMAHHRKYRYITHYDNRLLFLNILFLLVIAFIPFPSSVISKYSDRSATIFYALTMASAGLLLAVNWGYASHNNRLINPSLGKEIRTRQLISPLLTAGIFLLSVLVSYWSMNLSRLTWLLILLTSWYANKD